MSESTPDVATEAGDELLLALADDYLRRCRAGEEPTVDEYVAKHPELADRIHEVFPAMIAMEQPGATVDLAPPTERVGATIGRYKLLERIGEGGFGVVYMAEQQQPVRRKVALKLVKPGMDSRQVLARFEAERQALAIMDHPNIAKVFDAGATDSGRPYFVMELIRGEPITEFCDRNQFTPQQRLELFAQVCHAVQHAHQKGIIHRDIKPTNVLVGMHDTTPVVKVIDFGVAKALGQELTDKTLFTGFAQFLGTPLYMSPEQAGQSVLDVDTRSDIYSLGVLLYELLTGTTPFDKERFKKAAQDEILRIIREEEPPTPSTRLSQIARPFRPGSAHGPDPAKMAGLYDSASIAAQRQTEPAKLTKLVRGELDWIVMKALEKDRNRRYETANALANDIERYLHDEPVAACPPSVRYKLRKFLRKHRAPLAIAAAFVVLLTTASVVSTWQAVRATRAERQVAHQRDQVQTALVEKEASERRARQRLATQLIAVGDAALASGRSPAQDSYREAWEIARELGVSELPATTGLLASFAEQPPPLMGSNGRHGDIGGFEGHQGSATVVFTPDGRRAVSADGDGSMIVWDVPRGTSVRSLPGVGQKTNHIALSPDGRWLLTADCDNALRLWDKASGEMIRKFVGHHDMVREVAFSPDAKRAISGSSDRTVRLWDIQTGEELRCMDAPSFVGSVAFSPDGRRALSGGEPDAVVLWDLESGRPIYTLTEGSGMAVLTVAFSPDGRQALSGGLDHGIVLWDLEAGKALRTFIGHTARVNAVQFSPDGKQALSVSADRTVRLWDVASARQLGVWHGHANQLQSVCFSPDGQLALSADADGAIKLWDLRDQRETVVFRGHTDRVISLAASTDGRTVLSGSFDKTARLWDVATGLPILTLEAGNSLLWGVALAPDGRTALTAHSDGTLAHWDLHAASRLRSLGKHDDVVTAVTFSPDGRSALTSSSDSTLKLWDLQSGEEVRTFTGHAGKVRAVAFSPDGRTGLSASFDCTLKLWDINSGRELDTFAGHAHWVHSAAFSPDGLKAASGGWDHRVGLWNVAERKNIYFKRSAPEIVTGVAFSPDGKLLLSGNMEGCIGLWDLVNNEHVRDLRQQHRRFGENDSNAPTTTMAWRIDHGITSVAFCRDGVTMLAGSRDGVILRWQLDRPRRYDEFAMSLPQAREALQRDPNDAGALATFGQWYAFRGVYDWAAEFFEKARERGANVSSLELARCYWQLDRRDEAAREFSEAIRRNEAPRHYLELCRSAVEKPLTVEQEPATKGQSPADVPLGAQSR